MKRHLVPRGLLSVACLGLLASGAAAETPAPAAAPAAPAPEAAAPPKSPAAPAATPAAPPELAPWTASPGNEVAPSEPAAATGAAAAPAAPPSAAPTKAAATSTEPASTAGARRTSPRARSSATTAALATPTATDLAPKDEPSPAPLTPVATTPSFDFSIGMGSQLVSHAGLDAFSDDNAVPEFQLGLSAALNELGWAQLAAVARAGFGGTSGTNRGQPTELGTTKLGLGAELRAPAFERLYLFARVMPQAVHVSTELHETSSGVVLSQDQWTFGLDSALGAVLRIAELRPSGLERGLGLFLRLEGGYAWTPAMDVELAASGSNSPVRTEPLRLGELALSGFSFGGALGLGY